MFVAAEEGKKWKACGCLLGGELDHSTGYAMCMYVVVRDGTSKSKFNHLSYNKKERPDV